MKRLLALFLVAFLYTGAMADSTVTKPPGAGSVTLKRGSANVDTTLTSTTQCQPRAITESERLNATANKPVKATYYCNTSAGFEVTFTPPPPVVVPPKPTDAALYKQTLQCAQPLVGSFDQVRDFTLISNQWTPTPWLPATAPDGACKQAATSLLPVIDTTKIPAAAVGWSGPRLQATSQTINPADVGAFRLGCFYSHMSFNDPIVFPGQPGKSHLHVFFGNTGSDASSTAASIASTGNSTCSGGTLNRTSYWAPAMIDTTDGSPVTPSALLVYYKTGYGGVKPADVRAVPTGLRMVSGLAAGNPTNPSGAGRYACVGGDKGVGWQATIPSTCYQNNSLIMEVDFPQCWDGINLDSPDHKSHMADATGSGCPKTHPVALPAIAYEIYYDLSKVTLANMARWRLASDNYAVTAPGGYSSHGDYLMGWDPATMAKIIKNCDNPSMDCHANLLGDGTWLY